VETASAHRDGGSLGGFSGGPDIPVGPTTGHAHGSATACRVTTASCVVLKVVRSWAIVAGPSYSVRISAWAGPTVSWSTARCHITDIRAPTRLKIRPAMVGLVCTALTIRSAKSTGTPAFPAYRGGRERFVDEQVGAPRGVDQSQVAWCRRRLRRCAPRSRGGSPLTRSGCAEPGTRSRSRRSARTRPRWCRTALRVPSPVHPTARDDRSSRPCPTHVRSADAGRVPGFPAQVDRCPDPTPRSGRAGQPSPCSTPSPACRPRGLRAGARGTPSWWM
jgi:hypothetical protein